jgi:hypothetical protein
MNAEKDNEILFCENPALSTRINTPEIAEERSKSQLHFYPRKFSVISGNHLPADCAEERRRSNVFLSPKIG